ncbi:uncharacterized protein SAPINGB_P002372 [Magnusiomyces paraingens]|uniref:MICOS complex subunit MIC19 n=1 Tax=Magnusiomyces paraingens TaxID=2606893 RepID=A0A5E8BDK3_9ASCO|nr:uncharacterized protein SAPINGB_P002372 [Saprochaete ingens]VVT49645.1 unnamed protein product [Saprochaete ingens]
MGQASSTEKQPSTKVFLPSTPTQFSAGLISKMDTSIESDYTRSQYTEKYIQDRVAQELEKIEQDAASALKKAFDESTNPSADNTSSSSSNSISSADLRAQVKQLSDKLEATRTRHTLDNDTSAARSAVAKCLTDNATKPLKCYDEYLAFKQKVAEYEQKL